jgi:hypothetical protein
LVFGVYGGRFGPMNLKGALVVILIRWIFRRRRKIVEKMGGSCSERVKRDFDSV